MGAEKSHPPLGFDSWISQYAVSLCIECAVLVRASFHSLFNLFFCDFIIILFDAIQSELLISSVNKV